MKLATYIGGIIGLYKDFFRFIVFGLKNPVYIAVLLAVIIGIFSLNGIPPREISGFLSGKWNAFVENRKQTFKEDYQLLSKRFLKKEETFLDLEKAQEKDAIEAKKRKDKRAKEHAEQQVRQMQEETFGWQQAFERAEEEKIQEGNHSKRQDNQIREYQYASLEKTKKREVATEENAVKGILTVVGADRVRIGETVFTLKVRLRSGKAGEAFQDLKRRFDGGNAKCFTDKDNPEKAECFVGKTSLSQMLVDYAYADPL